MAFRTTQISQGTTQEKQTLQSLQQSLWQRWQRSGFRVPDRLLVWIPSEDQGSVTGEPVPQSMEEIGEFFLVLEDHQGILRLMNDQGQIYSAIRRDCYQQNPGSILWTCPKADMILCHGDMPVDRFALQDLIPLITDQSVM